MGAVAGAVGALGSALGGGGILTSVVGTLASNLIGGLFAPDTSVPAPPPIPEAEGGKTPEEVAREEAARQRALQRRQGNQSLIGIAGEEELSSKKTLLGS